MTFSQQDTQNLRRIADALERVAASLERIANRLAPAKVEAAPLPVKPECFHQWEYMLDPTDFKQLKRCRLCGDWEKRLGP